MESILVLHAGALGDFVLTLHVVAGFRKCFPPATVHMVARCGLASWAVRRGWLDSVDDPETCRLHGLYDESGTCASDVKLPHDVDRVLSFLGGPDTACARNLRSLYGGQRVIAVNPNPSAETLRRGWHITRQWLADIAAAGIVLPELDGRRLSKRRTRASNAGRKVIVHPGSGGRDKCCPLSVLEVVVERLQHRGCEASWMVGPVELDLFGEDYVDSLRRGAPVVYEESLASAADVISRADVFIGNDAGMSHLAAACGVRTVALFGPTDPAVWRPLGPAVEVLRLDFARGGTSAAEHAQRIVDTALTA